jgi:diacylglycerol kinase (ATP)
MSSLHYPRIPVIINPASGPDRPVLSLLNAAFQRSATDWEVHVTLRPGDAGRFARWLTQAGAAVVAVYGGDGTVNDVAAALAHSGTHLLILPGGTGNALAFELGIPEDTTLAAALACGAPARLRPLDLGEANGHLFTLRATMGFETELQRSANRQLKDQLGKLAYPAAALQMLETVPVTRYQINLDGRDIAAQGVQCTVANSAQMGVAGLELAQGGDVSDGLLDIIVLRRMDLAAMASIALSNLFGEDVSDEVQHWQGRNVFIRADPPQAVALGEDLLAETPIAINVVPGALQVIVPEPVEAPQALPDSMPSLI